MLLLGTSGISRSIYYKALNLYPVWCQVRITGRMLVTSIDVLHDFSLILQVNFRRVCWSRSSSRYLPLSSIFRNICSCHSVLIWAKNKQQTRHTDIQQNVIPVRIARVQNLENLTLNGNDTLHYFVLRFAITVNSALIMSILFSRMKWVSNPMSMKKDNLGCIVR
jgi:hypothetical protein